MTAQTFVELSSGSREEAVPSAVSEVSFIGLGSNLNDPKRQVSLAIEHVAKIPNIKLLVQSSFYRSAPMGPQDQSPYINVVLKTSTALSPLALLGELQGIENAFGRDRSVERWGPRVIDLDILLFGRRELTLKNIKIPHPGLSKRDFVLLPLLEIAPQLRLPNGTLLADLAEQVPKYDLERL